MLMSDTKSTRWFPDGSRSAAARRRCSASASHRRATRTWSRPRQLLAAALGHHVEEHAARRHGDVVRAGRDLDVVERVEVVIEAGGADRRRIADVDAVQVAGVLRAGRAARVEHALQAARCAADVGTRDQQARHLVFDERPDVAAAGRALQQLLAQVDAGVRARRVDDRRGAGYRHRFRDGRHGQLHVERHGLADARPGRSHGRRCGSPAVRPSPSRCPAAATESDSRRRYRSTPDMVPDDQHRARQRDRYTGHRSCLAHRSRGPEWSPSALALRRVMPRAATRARAESQTRYSIHRFSSGIPFRALQQFEWNRRSTHVKQLA